MNKILLVTGGTRGIGLAVAKQFADQGFDVITCSRNEDEGREWENAMTREFNRAGFYFFRSDMSLKTEVLRFAKAVKNELRIPDVLVNNSGYYLPGSVLKEKDGTIESMIETNLYSAYHMVRQFVPEMIKRGAGHVFNICSIASITPYVNGGSYCISKFGMLGMSKVLREETKNTGVKVTAILPGAVKTRSWEGVDLPGSRFIKPEDVAEAIWSAYTMSPGATVEELVIRPQEGDI